VLLYVLLAAALAAGLLMSAFRRPEPTLAASATCYGLCPSVTTLTLSKSTVTFGSEQLEKFSVKVSAASGTGVPTGFVDVKSGIKILCSIHLATGVGSCSPAAKALRVGSHSILAHYAGDTHFKPSTSSRQPLLVVS
jgi:hypothetical protein